MRTDVQNIVGQLLDEQLDCEAFEAIVRERWDADAFIGRCPSTLVDRIERMADESPDAPYGGDRAIVEFSSRLLFGAPDRPSALRLSGPGEARSSPRLADRNQPPHWHLTARIAVITRGSGTFYAHRDVDGVPVVCEVPIGVGDVLFWPGRTVHTFDAGSDGMCMLCAMAEYVPAQEMEFTEPSGIDLDALPRRRYRAMSSGQDDRQDA